MTFTSASAARSATSSRAPECRARNARSRPRSMSEHGIATAPARSTPSMTGCQSSVLPQSTSTRSPLDTPSLRSRFVQRAVLAATSVKVTSWSAPSFVRKRIARRAGSAASTSTTSREKLNRSGTSQRPSWRAGANTARDCTAEAEPATNTRRLVSEPPRWSKRGLYLPYVLRDPPTDDGRSGPTPRTPGR